MDSTFDLHIHTRFSDGHLEPEEIVKKRSEEGYTCIAITDHDGIGGSQLCFEQNLDSKYNIRIIPGIEFDSSCDLGKDMHILGYDIDFNSEELRNTLDEIDEMRRVRNDGLLKALNNAGYDITQEELDAINGGRYIGKPTFAKVLNERGLIPSFEYAFKMFHDKPELKAIKKAVLSTDHVIDVIHKAGGKAVLAHPMEQLKVREGETFEEFKPRLDAILNRMLSYGIDGIECIHPSAGERQSKYLEEFADEHGLLKTRGSDFHFEGSTRDFKSYHR
ncbi:MAG: PHP domain-containing protein [Clostridiales bacterium]|nr:PHP domain-containing protein [Candidatus Crickella caballi]